MPSANCLPHPRQHNDRQRGNQERSNQILVRAQPAFFRCSELRKKWRSGCVLCRSRRFAIQAQLAPFRNREAACLAGPDISPFAGENNLRLVRFLGYIGFNEDKPGPKSGKIENNISQETDELQVVLTGERGNIGTCEACGFPVSEGRKLCLDCESSGAPQDATTAPFLSQFTAPEESWLRSHQYLIGTLLVTALTIIVLAWMR